MHLCVLKGNIQTCKALVEMGSNMNAKDKVFKCNIDKLLHDHDVNIDLGRKDATSLGRVVHQRRFCGIFQGSFLFIMSLCFFLLHCVYISHSNLSKQKSRSKLSCCEIT